MQISLQELQIALVKEIITVEQFCEVLVDNFGRRKARKILEHNLKIALKNQEKNGRIAEDGLEQTDSAENRNSGSNTLASV